MDWWEPGQEQGDKLEAILVFQVRHNVGLDLGAKSGWVLVIFWKQSQWEMPTVGQGSDPRLLHCRRILCCWATSEARGSIYKHRQHSGGSISIYEFGKNVNIQSRTVQNEYDIITCLQRFFSVQKIKGDTLKKNEKKQPILSFVYSTTLSIYCVSSLGYKNCWEVCDPSQEFRVNGFFL